MLPQIVKDKIVNLAQRQGYVSFEIESQEISKQGSNYMSDLYKMNVKGKGVDIDQETNIFVKKIIPTSNQVIASFLKIEVAYQNELYLYNKVLTTFNELQEEFEIPMEKRFKTAKCFDESNEEVIFLEDLTYKGFKTYGRMDEVSLKFVELSVQSLAKFHALSFALEIIRPTYWKAIDVTNMKPAYMWNESRNAWLENLMRMTVENIKDEEVKNRVGKFIPEAVKKYPHYFDNNRSDIVGICHGDYRPMNIMVKEINGIETEVIPVDFQNICYGCPINDFIFFIFSLNIAHHIRSNHNILNQLKDLYYTTLTEFCEYFNIDIEKKMPRAKFEKIVKERLEYGLIAATIYALVDFGLNTKVIDDFAPEQLDCVKSLPAGGSKIKLDDKFLDRYMSIVEKFIEWGYLKK